MSIDDFLLCRDPVRAADYIDFINALAATKPDLARRRVPRFKADDEALWQPSADGLYKLAEQKFEGRQWHPDWPAFGLSMSDARAYCQWASQQLGRRMRLPTEHEWEYAARGSTGFEFPWGQRHDSLFCNMRNSRVDGPGPEPIGTFERDRSFFGIRDMAGGVHEWCESDYDEERGMKALRGGSWISDAARCRSAARMGDQPYDRHITYGFRLAADLNQPTELRPRDH